MITLELCKEEDYRFVYQLVEDFFKTVVNLKLVQRKGWTKKLDIAHVESVADHSYSMAMMSMILSDLQGIDTSKIMKMALLHDLVESITGDFTPDEISKDKNWGAALVEGACSVAVALMISTAFF